MKTKMKKTRESDNKKGIISLLIIGIVLIASGITLVAFNQPQSGGNPSEMGHSGDEIEVEVDGNTKDLNTALVDLDDYLNNIETDAINQLDNCEDDLTNCEDDLSDSEGDLSDCQSEAGECADCNWNGERDVGKTNTGNTRSCWEREYSSHSCPDCNGYCSEDCVEDQYKKTYVECDGEKITNFREEYYYDNCHCTGACHQPSK